MSGVIPLMYFSIPCRKRDTDQPEAVVWRFLVSVYALIKYEVHMRFVLGCFLALTLLKTTSAQEPVGELGAVLSLAAQYVAKYEGEQLGNLLVTEEYLQSSAEYDPVRNVPGRNVVASRDKRRLESDFLILQVGTTRVGVRLVNKVDGVRVKSTTG